MNEGERTYNRMRRKIDAAARNGNTLLWRMLLTEVVEDFAAGRRYFHVDESGFPRTGLDLLPDTLMAYVRLNGEPTYTLPTLGPEHAMAAADEIMEHAESTPLVVRTHQGRVSLLTTAGNVVYVASVLEKVLPKSE